MKLTSEQRVALHGFNNLTKSLSFNMYDICYTKTRKEREEYIAYIDHQYNADRLTTTLETVANIIGAHVLNIAKQDYEPQGASVTMLVSEGPIAKEPDEGISTFRADIDVSTCGEISPLKALNYLIQSFDTDIMTMDYRVRGFTRDVTGQKLFIDHEISSIQNYIPAEIKELYDMIDVNVYQENIFHTKCKLREFDLDNYLFGHTKGALSPEEQGEIEKSLKREMYEIFYGKNMAFS